MARFYASIKGERGQATRMGHHGITGHIRGWGVGVRVLCKPKETLDPDPKKTDSKSDVCYVYATGGSRGTGAERLIATVDKDGIHFERKR